MSSSFSANAGVVAHLEDTLEMGLEAVAMPDSSHASLADPHRCGHGSSAPVRGVGRRLLGRLADDLGRVRISSCRRRTGRRACRVPPSPGRYLALSMGDRSDPGKPLQAVDGFLDFFRAREAVFQMVDGLRSSVRAISMKDSRSMVFRRSASRSRGASRAFSASASNSSTNAASSSSEDSVSPSTSWSASGKPDGGSSRAPRIYPARWSSTCRDLMRSVTSF